MGAQRQKTLRTFRSPKTLAGPSRATRNDLAAFGVLSTRAVQRQAAEFNVEGLLNERPEHLVVIFHVLGAIFDKVYNLGG